MKIVIWAFHWYFSALFWHFDFFVMKYVVLPAWAYFTHLQHTLQITKVHCKCTHLHLNAMLYYPQIQATSRICRAQYDFQGRFSIRSSVVLNKREYAHSFFSQHWVNLLLNPFSFALLSAMCCKSIFFQIQMHALPISTLWLPRGCCLLEWFSEVLVWTLGH